MWQPFDRGRSIGMIGTESGVILLDDEHSDGARITLERGGRTPFAITCGVYGWMVHTRFFAEEAEARRAFDEMKRALDAIVRSITSNDDPDRDVAIKAATRMVNEFVERFP
jgi:hypothetical protein